MSKLSARFGSVAKKFGSGIKSALKFAFAGSAFSIAANLIQKVINPLEGVAELIKSTLSDANDVVTAAGEFESTPSTIQKIQSAGKAAGGIEPQEMLTLLRRFHTSIIEARAIQADPTKSQAEKEGLAVSQFTEEKDVGTSFLNFLDSIRKVDPKVREQAMFDVFGERMTGKAQDLVQNDLFALLDKLGVRGKDLSPELEKLNNLSGLSNFLAAQEDLRQVGERSRNINEEQVRKLASGDAAENDRNVDRLANFENLFKTQEEAKNILHRLEQLVTKMPALIEGLNSGMIRIQEVIGSIGGTLSTIGARISELTKSPVVRGILNKLGFKDN
jgi:hypothetical protein